MSAHKVTISAPIRRKAFDISRVVRVLRCDTCPGWRKEVYEGLEVAKVKAAHEQASQ